MALSAYERETSIVLNDEEDTAHVYTAQPAMMRRLARHTQAVLVARHEDEGGRVTGEEWDLPKALVSIRAGKRPMSQAQREVLRRASVAGAAARKGHFAPKTTVGTVVSHGGGPGVEKAGARVPSRT